MTEVLILLVAEQKRIFKVGFKSDGIFISGKNIEFYKISEIQKYYMDHSRRHSLFTLTR